MNDFVDERPWHIIGDLAPPEGERLLVETRDINALSEPSPDLSSEEQQAKWYFECLRLQDKGIVPTLRLRLEVKDWRGVVGS